MNEPPPKNKSSAWPLYLVLGGFAAAMAFTVHTTGRAKRAAKRYVAAIQAGNLDEAYAMLTDDNRRALDREQFEERLFTAELHAAKRPAWDYASNGSNGKGCAEAAISVDGGRKSLRVYLLKEDNELRVHEVLLYSGPAPREPWRCKSSPP